MRENKILKLTEDLIKLEKKTRNYRWQPIETAPKDETTILLYSKKSIFLGYFQGNEFILPNNVTNSYYLESDEIKNFTHWASLPELPND